MVGDDPEQHKTSVKTPKGKPGRPRTKAAAPAVSTSTSASGSRTPVGEDWMLDCEICHRSGINKVNGYAKIQPRHGFAHTWKLQDDGSPLLCCGKCSKWQHIACHDLADRKAGRPKRDWDKEEFICRNCQSGRSLGFVANGSMRQVLNGSSSSSAAAAAQYDAGRTPSHYHQTSGYAGQPPYGQNYLHASLPHQQLRPAPPYQHHTAITFSHYQPQQRGFTSHSSSSPHSQPAIPQAPTSYTQPHYSTHGSPSKLSQYPTPQASRSFTLVCFPMAEEKTDTSFLTVPFTYILKWHILAHARICIPFLLFSCTCPFWPDLVHACADCYYQLPNDVIVIAVIFTPSPLSHRRALFDVRRWRRALCCYFYDCCCCAEWEHGYGYGYG